MKGHRAKPLPDGKNLPTVQETFNSVWGWKDPLWRKEWLPPPVFLPGEFHGQRSLVGYSSWGQRVKHN